MRNLILTAEKYKQKEAHLTVPSRALKDILVFLMNVKILLAPFNAI